jgi:arabinogalactan oligomer/maltooligosaccharide transport system permease protein
MVRRALLLFCLVASGFSAGCGERSERRVVTLWHQMVPRDRVMLNQLVDEFEKLNDDIDVRTLYKETEELRSGYQAAALAGIGPELIYGPSDVMGTYHTMGIVADMDRWVPEAESAKFIDGALTYLPNPKQPSQEQLVLLPDRFGNHLALVYNRNLVPNPPTTTDELIGIAKAVTFDPKTGERTGNYGLVWNYVEPFFAVPFITGYGAWVFDESGKPVPNLDTPEAAAAYEFILSLRDQHKITPQNCDYETADSLFKTGKAAMIINGDWSWTDYLETDGIDAAVAPLPTVSATGKAMVTMISPKGYSLNPFVSPQAAEDAMKFAVFMTSEDSQRKFMELVKILPSRKALLEDPLMLSDPTLRASKAQLANGRIMPVVTEMRATWDAMRPPYQKLMGGSANPGQAAREMQANAERGIELIHRKDVPETAAWVWQLAGILICGGLVVWQRESLLAFLPDIRKQPFAYLLIAPALLVMFATVVFPFFYNVLLSLSNMSLTNYQDWQIIGFQNYSDLFNVEVIAGVTFAGVLLKTILWTIINIAFHVGIGLALALALNGPIRGKSLYRVMLIIPWAVPAYITALTWRSMFHYDYGAVNLIAMNWLGLPPVNWLGEPNTAFTACIVANVWLGYPFMMVIALGGLQGIPQELYEAARIDGANRWQQFLNVTLPLLKPVLAPAVTLGAIWTFNNLNVVWLVSNTGEPADQTHILVSYVYKAVFNFYRYGYGAALSMVIFAILLTVSLLSLNKTRATESVYS